MSNDASRVDPALAVDKARSADFSVDPSAVSSDTVSTCTPASDAPAPPRETGLWRERSGELPRCPECSGTMWPVEHPTEVAFACIEPTCVNGPAPLPRYATDGVTDNDDLAVAASPAQEATPDRLHWLARDAVERMAGFTHCDACGYNNHWTDQPPERCKCGALLRRAAPTPEVSTRDDGQRTPNRWCPPEASAPEPWSSLDDPVPPAEAVEFLRNLSAASQRSADNPATLPGTADVARIQSRQFARIAATLGALALQLAEAEAWNEEHAAEIADWRIERVAALATVAALTAERDALREIVQDFALVEHHTETRAHGESDMYRMPFARASWFDSREAAVADWLRALTAERGARAQGQQQDLGKTVNDQTQAPHTRGKGQ